MATERKKQARTKGNKQNASFGVLIVQCIACLIVVLFVWLFASLGGSTAKQLRGFLKEQLGDNSLAAAVSVWIDEQWGNGEDKTASDHGDDSSDEIPDEKTDAAFVASVSPPAAEYAVTALPIAQTAGTVTSLYGTRDNPTAAGEEFHKGLDIAAERGTDIAALMFGVVTDAGTDRWLGHYVVLAHGNLEVTYAHCSEITVKVGRVVKAGETVAKVGSTGNSTGNHLHIEMRKDGVLFDPAAMVAVTAYD